jgi:hypothetical protein
MEPFHPDGSHWRAEDAAIRNRSLAIGRIFQRADQSDYSVGGGCFGGDRFRLSPSRAKK